MTALLGLCATARAADHRDFLGLLGADEGDLTDLYAWMSPDGTKLNLVLGWEEGATQFSDAILWAFRVESRASFRAAKGSETVIVCGFDAAQRVSCWAGPEYLTGDASGGTGVASASGRLRVWAGRRNDPFFHNLDGFRAAVARVRGGLGVSTDAAGCPALDGAQSAAVLEQLRTGSDAFARAGVLAIVVQIDRALVTAGGPVVGVSASTHKKAGN